MANTRHLIVLAFLTSCIRSMAAVSPSVGALLDTNGTLASPLSAKLTVTLDTFADFETVPRLTNATYVLRGYHTVGGGGGGEFVWNSTLTAGTNRGTVIKPNDVVLGGRFTRQVSGPIDPKMFGAKADGSTDDLPAMQDCWNQAKTNGLSIYLPAGNYVTTDTWMLDSTGIPGTLNGITIFGDGPGRTVITPTGTNGPGILMNDCHSVLLSGIQIAAHVDSVAPSGIVVSNSTWCLFDNLQVIGFTNNIYFQGGPSLNFSHQIRGCLIADGMTNILSDKANVSSLRIGPANEIRAKTNNVGVGIHISGYVDSIEDNVIETIGTGIEVVGGLGDTQHIISIRHNYFENCGYDITFVNDASLPRPIVIDSAAGVVYGCTIEENRFNNTGTVVPIYSVPEPGGGFGCRILNLKILNNVYAGTVLATHVDVSQMAVGGVAAITDISFGAADHEYKYVWGNHAPARVWSHFYTAFQPYPATTEIARFDEYGLRFGGTNGGYVAKDIQVYGGATIFSHPVVVGTVLDFQRWGITNLTIEKQITTNYFVICSGTEGVDYVFTNDTRHITIIGGTNLVTDNTNQWLFASYNYLRGSDTNITVFGDLIGKGTNAFFGTVSVQAETNAYAVSISGNRTFTNDWTGIRNGVVSQDGGFDLFRMTAFSHSIGGNVTPAAGLWFGQSNRTYTGVGGYVDVIASDILSGTPTTENKVARFSSGGLDLSNAVVAGTFQARTNYLAPNGNVNEPGYSFTNDTYSGLYLAAPYRPAITAGGTLAITFGGLGNKSWVPFEVDDFVKTHTNTVPVDAVTVKRYIDITVEGNTYKIPLYQ